MTEIRDREGNVVIAHGRTVTCANVRTRYPRAFMRSVACCESCHDANDLCRYEPEETVVDRSFVVCCDVGLALIAEGIVRL